jgi:hypothetical protein
VNQIVISVEDLEFVWATEMSVPCE